jgi:hypothetical protein
MTPDALLSELCNFPTPLDSSREVLPAESRLSHVGTEDPLHGNSEAGSISPRPDEAEHWLRYHEQRRAALDVTLGKLRGLDLAIDLVEVDDKELHMVFQLGQTRGSSHM